MTDGAWTLEEALGHAGKGASWLGRISQTHSKCLDPMPSTIPRLHRLKMSTSAGTSATCVDGDEHKLGVIYLKYVKSNLTRKLKLFTTY